MKNITRKRVGLKSIILFYFPRVPFIAVLRCFSRFGMPEHPVADTVPDVSHELVTARLWVLTPGSFHEIVGRIIEEHILIAYYLLEHGCGAMRAPYVIAQSPANVVEIVVLKGPVKI